MRTFEKVLNKGKKIVLALWDKLEDIRLGNVKLWKVELNKKNIERLFKIDWVPWWLKIENEKYVGLIRKMLKASKIERR